MGLSPRLRGNPNGIGGQYPGFGSIPAPAGEPVVQVSGRQHDGVYPRACGGTRMHLPVRTPRQGLSPRLRGNH